MGGTACLKPSGSKFSHALAETCVTLGSGWSHLKGASSEPYISYLPLLCGSTCGVFSCVCWQSGLCPQAWLGQCVLDCTSLCCSSQVWLFKQKPEYLDSLVKYHSCTSGLGRCYVEPRKVNGEWRGSFLLQGTWLGVCHLLCMGGLLPRVFCAWSGRKMLVEC